MSSKIVILIAIVALVLVAERALGQYSFGNIVNDIREGDPIDPAPVLAIVQSIGASSLDRGGIKAYEDLAEAYNVRETLGGETADLLNDLAGKLLDTKPGKFVDELLTANAQ